VKPSTLDRYLAGRFAAIYLASLVSFSLLYVLVDSMSQYGALAAGAAGFWGFLRTWSRFYWAQLPILFCRVLGPVTLAASAAFVVTLVHRANEFTPMLAAGISMRRALAPVLALTLFCVLGSAAVQEVWIPSHRDEIREAKAPGRGRVMARHAKYLDAQERILYVFRRYYLRELRGEGVLIFSLEGHRGKGFLIKARSAQWVEPKGNPGRWILENGLIQEYDGGGSLILPGGSAPAPPRPAGSPLLAAPAAPSPLEDPAANRLFSPFKLKPLSELTETGMRPEDLEERESQEPYLWLSEVWRKVQEPQIEETARYAARWQVRLYGRLADPLHGLILVLLGLPTILSRGTRNIFMSAIATVVISTLYFIAYTFFLNLGNRGVLPPAVATGLPPLFFGALGVTLYSRLPS
jgi:lipopolysaccharide export LptBFGC system permease protein LptF